MNAAGASLVIGATGLLGRAISERLRSLGHRVAEARRQSADGSPSLDISAMARSWKPPSGVATAYLCAAVTSQRVCRASFKEAYAVNVTNTVVLARRLVDAGIFVVFPSTNLVFDGSRPQEQANAARCPRTAYGRMKAHAEERLLAIGAGIGIVRLTKVVHGHLPIFAQWQSSLTRDADVHPYYDMVFSPVLLREAVSVLITAGRVRAEGVMQISAQDDISYAEACRLLAKYLTVPEARVKPVSWQDDRSGLEHVPEHTTLETGRAEEVCGFVPRKAHAVLEEVFAHPTALRGASGHLLDQLKRR